MANYQCELCYKIHMAMDDMATIVRLINDLAKIGDCLFLDDSIAIWLEKDKNKKDILLVLKKHGVQEFFCEMVNCKAIVDSNNYGIFYSWISEHYSSYIIAVEEDARQEELTEMYNNIMKAHAELDKKIAESKKEVYDGGRN